MERQDSVKLSVDSFGSIGDAEVLRYTFTNDKNITVKIINYGGIITDVFVPDKHGAVKDINLGYDDLEGYVNDPSYLGALIGRFANRIAKGKFKLDGKEYNLDVNHPPNTVHGGKKGFNKYLWKSKIEDNKVVMTHVSEDGNEGYPGELTSTVTFELTADGELILNFKATTTAATPVNLSTHPLFNLAGHDCEHLLDDHVVTIPTDKCLPKNDDYLPTDITTVEGTPSDLRKPVNVGERLHDISGGFSFDHTYCFNNSGELEHVAKIEHPPSGRYLEMSTTEPSVQFYTSGFLNVQKAKGGAVYKKYQGICLLPQHYPDSVNRPEFPNTIVRPGETYQQTTVFKFGTSV